jgi:hypothetical protein
VLTRARLIASTSSRPSLIRTIWLAVEDRSHGGHRPFTYESPTSSVERDDEDDRVGDREILQLLLIISETSCTKPLEAAPRRAISSLPPIDVNPADLPNPERRSSSTACQERGTNRMIRDWRRVAGSTTFRAQGKIAGDSVGGAVESARNRPGIGASGVLR